MGGVDETVGLPAAARYVPFEGGRYEVKPGLARFGKPMGNGSADARVFQIDAEFGRYRAAKEAGRREALGKYHLMHEQRPAVAQRVTRFIVGRLTEEHPKLFEFENGVMECHLTGERLVFDRRMELVGSAGPRLEPPYILALDALACQVQEDLAVLSVEDQRHWISALHICFPNHWAPEEKIGKGFAAIHAPVAEMGPMNAREAHFARVMVEAADGLVRFAWGIDSDEVLNRHPDVPAGLPAARRFDPAEPRAFVRVERQTIWGFPEVEAALFTIRTYFMDCTQIRRDLRLRGSLIAAIESMSPQSLRYKGMAEAKGAILRWLASG